MRFDKFTAKLQQAIADAQSLAVGRGHNQMEPAHLLLALLDNRDTGIKALVQKAGGDAARMRDGLAGLLDDMPKVAHFDGEVQPSRDLIKLFNLTDAEAQKRGDQYIASELVLLAALAMKHAVSKVLTQAGVTQASLQTAIDTAQIPRIEIELDSGEGED